MRLYGSQSRISKSATRHARAHRPVSFYGPAVHRTIPVTPSRTKVKSESPATVLVPRSA